MLWAGDKEPPKEGVEIFSQTYFFHPNPTFGGKRIEPMKRYRSTDAERIHPDWVKSVDPFSGELFNEIFWSKVKAHKEAVLEFIASLDKNDPLAVAAAPNVAENLGFEAVVPVKAEETPVDELQTEKSSDTLPEVKEDGKQSGSDSTSARAPSGRKRG